MNEVTDITHPPVEICFVCRKPVEYRLRDLPPGSDLFRRKDGKLPFFLTHDRITHEECGEEIERQNALDLAAEKAARLDSEISGWLVGQGLPIDYHRKTLATFIPDNESRQACELVAKWQPADDFGFLLTGPAGTGKSHLGFAWMNVMIEDARAKASDVRPLTRLPRYVSAASLLASLRGNDSGSIYRYENAAALFLDDVGAENITDWSREIFFRLFEYRLNHRLPTFITTNLSPNELKDRFHERVVSRIMGMCVPISVGGKDRRRDTMVDRFKLLKERA